MKLPLSALKYREIIENIDLGLMEVDLEEKIVFANGSFCRSTGYEANELIGKVASEIFLPESKEYRKIINSQNNERLRGNSSVYEIRISHKDGSPIWMLISGAPVKNDKGQVIGSIGIHHDITSRKIEEEQNKKLLKDFQNKTNLLIQKQSFLQAINDFVSRLMKCDSIEQISDTITSDVLKNFDFEDCIVYLANEEKNKLYQVSAFGPKNKDGEIKNPIIIPFGNGIVGSVAKEMKSILVNDTRKDARYILDDEFRCSELAVPIIADGELLGVIDSEHPRANFFTNEHEQTLQTIANLSATKIRNTLIRGRQQFVIKEKVESEERIRSIINSSLDAVITINSQGLVTEWNAQASNIFKFSADEVIGKNLSTLIIPEEFRAQHEQGMKHYMRTGEGPVLNQRIELNAIDKFGDSFPIEISITPIKLKGQTFFSAFIRDITHKRKAESDMQKALDKERELSELKSKFVSLTSHEFRTPLTTIKANVELLEFQLEKTNTDLDSAIQKNFFRINNQIQRLSELMNDVLMINRIEAGKVPFHPDKIELRRLLEGIISDFTSGKKSKRKIDLFIPLENINCEIDHQIYRHIINNLVSNAFKYSKGSKNPEMRVYNKEHFVKISVKDYGIGIPEKDLPLLFKSFQRASNVGNIQGSGLGLSIVKEFLDLHQAEIEVKSIEGEGTEFIIIQPKKLRKKE